MPLVLIHSAISVLQMQLCYCLIQHSTNLPLRAQIIVGKEILKEPCSLKNMAIVNLHSSMKNKKGTKLKKYIYKVKSKLEEHG